MIDLELRQLSRTLDHLLGLSRMEITTAVEFEDFWEWRIVLRIGAACLEPQRHEPQRLEPHE